MTSTINPRISNMPVLTYFSHFVPFFILFAANGKCKRSYFGCALACTVIAFDTLLANVNC